MIHLSEDVSDTFVSGWKCLTCRGGGGGDVLLVTEVIYLS